jgi:hypothetical protein
LIDGGAHPNERGFVRSLQVEELEDGEARLTQIYLQAGSIELEHGLLATGKIGGQKTLCAPTLRRGCGMSASLGG